MGYPSQVVAAYHQHNPGHDKAMIMQVITDISSVMPKVLTELITRERTLISMMSDTPQTQTQVVTGLPLEVIATLIKYPKKGGRPPCVAHFCTAWLGVLIGEVG